MQRRLIIGLLAMSCYTPLSFAKDATIDMQLLANEQGIFKGLVEDLGSALSYKAISPAEPLGIIGFDISFEVSATKLESEGLNTAAGGDAPSTLYVPKLHLVKGLPFGMDVGAFYTAIPSSNIKIVGAEFKYAFMEGSTVLPAIAVRGTYTKLSGVDDLSFNSKGLDLSISKGFLMFTPYAGIGKVMVSGEPGSVAGLSSEDVTHSKQFIGVNINFGLMNIAAETDKTGDSATTSIKVGLRF